MRLRELRLKGNLELDKCAGTDWLGNRQIDDGLIIFIAIIGRDEIAALGQVSLTDDLDALDVLGTVKLVFPLVIADVAAAHELGVADERGIGLEGILIQVERKMVERLPGKVVIGQNFGRIHGVLGNVILGVDLIMHHALRHRRRRIDRQRRVWDGRCSGGRDGTSRISHDWGL